MEISLCMIVKNEEKVLGRCLESIKNVVDEIVIVDTGSTDKTKEIARKYTDKVYDFVWQDDFSAARNYAFSKGQKDYLMWLDADDVLAPKDAKALKQLKRKALKDVCVIMMPYDIAFDGQGNPTFTYYRERIIKKDCGMKWEGAIHEAIAPKGKILYTKISVQHRKEQVADPDRNLRIFEKLIQKNGLLDPRQQFYYARELYYHQRYQEAELVLEKFLNSGLGWIENCIEACRCLADCRRAMGDQDGALKALLQSFCYDLPRAEVCCEIGWYFFQKEQWEKAAYWYQIATKCKKHDRSGAFVQTDYYEYIPYMQLCVCYDKMGNWKLANAFNEKAGKKKPNDPAYLHNRAYFNSVLQSKENEGIQL